MTGANNAYLNAKTNFMKLPLPGLLLLACCFTACRPDGSANSQAEGKPRIALRPFTDTLKQDTFKVFLRGDRPKNMELVFSITPAQGTPVYQKNLRASELIDNYKETVELGKEKEQLKFINEELNLFFDEENFLEPAVTENEEADKNTPDKKFFAELKKSGLNGFKYRLGKDKKIYIAWSVSEKKVLPYYECCQ